MAYWWCLKHGKVEGEDGCAHAERLGPYPTAQEAAHAIERAHERSDDWDQQDKEWQGR